MAKLKATDELIEALTYYEGAIPIYLKFLLNARQFVEYNENLKRLGIYDKVYDEYYEIRINHKRSKDKEAFCREELFNWLDENPKFKELIKWD